MGFSDFLKKIFPCCFKDESEKPAARSGGAEMSNKSAPKQEASEAAAQPKKKKEQQSGGAIAPKKQEASSSAVQPKKDGKEPEHFHDNDELAAKANVIRDKARALRDEAHKPENKARKGELLDQAAAEDRKASDMIFKELQKKQPEGTIDLHLQFVAEAVRICDEYLAIARKKKWDKLIIITGKGNHSEGGVCKIAGAVKEWAAKNNLTLEQGEGKVTVTIH